MNIILKLVIIFNLIIIGCSIIGFSVIYFFDDIDGLKLVQSNFQKHNVQFRSLFEIKNENRKRQNIENITFITITTNVATNVTFSTTTASNTATTSVKSDIVARCFDEPIEGHKCDSNTRHTLLASFLLTLYERLTFLKI